MSVEESKVEQKKKQSEKRTKTRDISETERATALPVPMGANVGFGCLLGCSP